MSKASRARVDYMPGPAALQALQAAQELDPQASTQAVIDRLVITGYAALLHKPWKPPALYGRNRERWKLPEELQSPESAD